MNRIQKLDVGTASKIAAGEVVEKPAMVVKELVENAIDAGATEIIVDIKKGGKGSIRVSDNGSGIYFDDVPLLFERHATSKIRSIDDLYRTRTLGFRGEALASICAVSQVEVITMRKEDQAGLKVLAAGGKILKQSEIGTVVGTTLTVSDLFFNTPARLKFLKADATETRYITELMNHLALSHPEVAFKYTADDKLVFHTSGKGKLKDAIFGVYDGDTLKNLFEIEETYEDIILKGFVSKFDYTKGTKSHQITFVNGRYVKSDFIKDVIQLAYKPYMMHNRYPVCFLFFDMPPEKLDVNIHPAKTEIKFHEEGKIKQTLFTALKKSFNLYNQVPKVTFTEKQVFVKSMLPEPLEAEEIPFVASKAFESFEAVDSPALLERTSDLIPVPKEESYKAKGLQVDSKSMQKPSQKFPEIDFEIFKQATSFVKEQVDVEEASEIIASTLYDELEFIGIFDQTYLILQKKGQLFLIDQHAAHEKVLYEQFMKDFENQGVMSQLLLLPESFQVEPLAFQSLNEKSSLLIRMGYEFEEFGTNTVVIRALPAHMPFPVAKQMFIEALEGTLEDDSAFKEAKMASKACKAAIKGMDKLEDMEVSALLNQLKGLNEPYTCPHGRPIIIQFSKYDIEKKFKRVL